VLCGLLLLGKMQAQEVIVAREKKPKHSRQTPEPANQNVMPSEEISSQNPAPTPRKPRTRQRKAAPATLTLEEMRAAGARAAGGSSHESDSQAPAARQPKIESTAPPPPIAVETPRPIKRETPVEQRSSSGTSKPRSTNMEGIGPVRPTMMESGRETPSPSPSG
jgi:hypothetical protein